MRTEIHCVYIVYVSEKTEVLTLRTDKQTRQWVEFLARCTERSKSAVLERFLSEKLRLVQCCERGPYECDHVWCDWCGDWARDNAGMHPDTGEAHWSCLHYQGMSRCSDEEIPPHLLQVNTHVDPFRMKKFRDHVDGGR